MQLFLIILFTFLSAGSFWLFLRGKYKLSPLWLMLSVWFIAIAISQLNLSTLELPWSGKYWGLLLISLISFCLGFFVFNHPGLDPGSTSRIPASAGMGSSKLRWVIYILFAISLLALYLFYQNAGNFPLLAPDPDAFRFTADESVPGLINYLSQLARIFIPLSFFVFFAEKFSWKKHWDLVLDIVCFQNSNFLYRFVDYGTLSFDAEAKPQAGIKILPSFFTCFGFGISCCPTLSEL